MSCIEQLEDSRRLSRPTSSRKCWGSWWPRDLTSPLCLRKKRERERERESESESESESERERERESERERDRDRDGCASSHGGGRPVGSLLKKPLVSKQATETERERERSLDSSGREEGREGGSTSNSAEVY